MSSSEYWKGLTHNEIRAQVVKYMETLLTQARTLARKARRGVSSVGSQIACHLAMLCSATMRVVSRDVIEHLSQTRVISSERRYPSLGDISNH
jgi:hypothetical protein